MVQADEGKIQRFALVIGNQNYITAPLSNPINDATAIASHLDEIGFSVTLLTDITAQQIEPFIESFYAQLTQYNNDKILVMIYYAGHAVQLQHRNYLVPIDVKLDNYASLLFSLYDINKLFKQIPNSKKINSIIILDACRNNPFEKINSNNGKPLISDGLAPIRAPSGTLLAYATAPGNVSFDGAGNNGVYTKHLLTHINEQISVEELFKKVRSGVANETKNKQVPWEHSSLFEDVFINPPKNKDIPDIMVF
jgi:uncharacterized caspase-like protein